MSTLARFRKPQGLVQLIRLIETSEPEKRVLLLGLVAKEDPGWAHMVQSKALTLPRIMSWPEGSLQLVLEHVPVPMLASLTQALDETQAARLKAMLRRETLLEVEEHAKIKRATKQEKWVATIKIYQIVRELQDEGRLRISVIDPGLDIDMRLTG